MEDVEDIRVGDVMTRGVICVDVKDTVQEAAQVMKKNDISSVLVTKKGDGVGILTERDIIVNVVADNLNPQQLNCKKVMNSPLITISPKADIDEAARLMRDKDIRRLVVTHKDKIVGLLSEFDIVKIEPELHLLLKEKYEWDISKTHAASKGQIHGDIEECGDYCELEVDDDEPGFG